MTRTPAQRRWLAIFGTGAVFASLLALLAVRNADSTTANKEVKKEEKKADKKDEMKKDDAK